MQQGGLLPTLFCMFPIRFFVVRITYLESGQIGATAWDIRLNVRKIPEGTTAVGIRMHDIRHGIGQNSYRCRVVDVVENPFTYTVFLIPISGKAPIPLGWELNKDIWQTIRADEITISIPEEAILLLKD